MSSSVITYRVGTQPQRIYAFVNAKQNHLCVNYWDGTQWKWADQGAPPGTNMEGYAGVITYWSNTFWSKWAKGGGQRIYAFVTGQNGHLYVNYWNGTQWNWADQGTPPGTKAMFRPGVITFLEGASSASMPSSDAQMVIFMSITGMGRRGIGPIRARLPAG